MKKFCLNLKTSDKITFLFTIFNFLSLIILLIGVNIIYFFAWYSDQKSESMYDMDMNYNMYTSGKNESNLEAFKEYILQKDTLIIPKDGGELICSNGVETKIHNDIDKIKDDLFYNNGEKIFFIFTQYYDDIGEVKVFFDTTPYVKSQILIIKISLIIIFISIFIYFIIGRKISRFTLKNLKYIAKKSKEIDIEKDFEKIEIIGNKDDEINVLAETLNDSFSHIKNQTYTLKQFITDVSHEFKTPLMVINSQIDLYNKKLEKGKLSENDILELLLKIKEKTHKLNNLLETFLLLSRIENKLEILEKREFIFDDYIKDVTDKYLLLNEKNNKINIKYKLEKNIKLELEEATFSVLFENLLGNAIKFSGDNANIEIGSTKNSFWIKDNGEGMSENQLEKIWDKFYRNDKNKQGFGIGLFLVKRLVILYGWDIRVESIKGEGTKFIINF